MSTVRIREKLFQRFVEAVIVHMSAEDKVLSKLLQQQVECVDEINQLIEEHHLFMVIILEMKDVPKTHERWGAKVRIVKDLLERHMEFEEIEFFEVLKDALTDDVLSTVWRNFTQARDRPGLNLAT